MIDAIQTGLADIRHQFSKFEQEFEQNGGYQALLNAVMDVEDLLVDSESVETKKIAIQLAETYAKMSMGRIRQLLDTDPSLSDIRLTRYYEILAEFRRLNLSLDGELAHMNGEVFWRTMEIWFPGWTDKQKIQWIERQTDRNSI